ncbi:MAG: DNA ligase-associated DEXH box helicase, partial [Gemmatimonadaceae bacterium]|nr:DNA ligase-associated DEXH box helicase [Gemmatimonadaceae bacterium]
ELRSTRAYAGLAEAELDWALDFVVRGGDALAAYPDYARVRIEDGRYIVADARTAMRHRLNIGTIVADTAIAVRYTTGGSLGSVEESFVSRMEAGDRFIFAGKPLEFVRLRDLTAFVRRARSAEGAIPSWQGSRMPLSTELSAAVRDQFARAADARYEAPEMVAVRPILELQRERSRIPVPDALLVERCETRDGHHLFVYPFEGRLVHEGLSALFAYRIAQFAPITFTFACNDYGFELLAAERAPLEEAMANGLLSTQHLLHDIVQSLNAAEMAKRQFREIARVAGLVFTGYPGQAKPMRQVQASTSLLYDVFARYDPDNLLLHQARREVLERQLEASRLGMTLARLEAQPVTLVDLDRPSPLAFPLLIDRTRAKLSSEKLADRVRRMTVALEREPPLPGAATLRPARAGAPR